MYKTEFDYLANCNQYQFEVEAQSVFLARRGSANALNRKFVLSSDFVLSVEDFYVHVLAHYFAGMANRIVFYDNCDNFGYYAFLKSDLERCKMIWSLLNKIIIKHDNFVIHLYCDQNLKCHYKFENGSVCLVSNYATNIYTERADCSSLDFKVGESFLAGAGNSLVAPKF